MLGIVWVLISHTCTHACRYYIIKRMHLHLHMKKIFQMIVEQLFEVKHAFIRCIFFLASGRQI